MYEARGTLKWIGDLQTFPSGFSKREFVVTTAHDKYPQDLKFEIVKDKCPMLDSFAVGNSVMVNFDIRGNEYNGRYFVNLSCWKIQPDEGGAASPAKAAAAPSAASPEPASADLRNEDDFDDDEVPF
jgi:hypothetical protein